MGRKAASSPIDRSVAGTRRRPSDSGQARRHAAQPRSRVAEVAKIPYRVRHPTTHNHFTATEVNEICPQVSDDFPHPVPILERELDAIEMYLGPLLDRMLQCKESPMRPDPGEGVLFVH
jgi:hypothetical protein